MVEEKKAFNLKLYVLKFGLADFVKAGWYSENQVIWGQYQFQIKVCCLR